MKKEIELRQLFKNRFDCYAVAYNVIMAMTEDMFIKILPEALDLANVSNRFKTRPETKDGTWFLNSEEIKQWEDDGSIEKGDKSYKTVLLREY